MIVLRRIRKVKTQKLLAGLGVFAMMLFPSCFNTGGLNTGQHQAGNEEDGVHLRFGDIAVDPGGSFFISRNYNRLIMGKIEGSKEAEVLEEGAVEQAGPLGNPGHTTSPLVGGDLGEGASVGPKDADGGLDEAEKEVGHRRLPRSRRPHEGGRGPGLHRERDVLEGGRPPLAVGESHPVEFQPRRVLPLPVAALHRGPASLEQWNAMSDEQKEELRKKFQEQMQNLSPEQRDKLRQQWDGGAAPSPPTGPGSGQ